VYNVITQNAYKKSSCKLVSNYICTTGHSTQQHLFILGKLSTTFDGKETFVVIVKWKYKISKRFCSNKTLKKNFLRQYINKYSDLCHQNNINLYTMRL